MAESGKAIDDLSFSAGEDLSGKQYTAVHLSGANQVKFATNASTSTLVGILQNKPASGQAAEVRDMGLTKWLAGGAITAGAVVTTNASGRAAAVASGQMGLGRALDAAGADGETLTVRLFSPVRWAGAA